MNICAEATNLNTVPIKPRDGYGCGGVEPEERWRSYLQDEDGPQIVAVAFVGNDANEESIEHLKLQHQFGHVKVSRSVRVHSTDDDTSTKI